MINAPPQINNITVTPVEILLEFWSLYPEETEETFGDKDDEVGDKNDEVPVIAIGAGGVANANNLADDKDVAGAGVANANNLADDKDLNSFVHIYSFILLMSSNRISFSLFFL
ncbi:hypothetical protein RIR_jg23395.t1 [Rhizophagus irregularis DAOM 181602=DAOM 197198]|nr:hypothetical protein RIR_jg23395.t1 [Rhizophagus irregularis DAOM 181602=DAOM 197198]